MVNDDGSYVDFNTKTAQAFDRREMAHDGMRARYDSSCPLCGARIQRGRDYVVHHPGLNRYIHELCPVLDP